MTSKRFIRSMIPRIRIFQSTSTASSNVAMLPRFCRLLNTQSFNENDTR